MRRSIPARATTKRSQLEEAVADELDKAQLTTAYEPITIRYLGREYTPDFIAVSTFTPRLIIEVKPTREIAANEVRSDMLVGLSPLWLIADLFIIAFDFETWICRGQTSPWHDCELSTAGLDIADEPTDWEPHDARLTLTLDEQITGLRNVATLRTEHARARDKRAR